MKTTQIVIPYVHKKASRHELLLTLRSMEKNFEFPFEVILIGDLPPWASEELKKNYIATTLIEGIQFCHSLDVNAKMKKILSNDKIDDSFIYTYDDVIILQPVSKNDLIQLRADSFIESEQMIQEKSTGSRKWNILLTAAYQYLKANNYPTFNFETHLPRFFKKKELSEIFEIPEFIGKPFLFSTLYFNMKYKAKPSLLGVGKADVKAAFGSEVTIDNIIASCMGKLFVNFNNKGFTPQLQKYLNKKFPTPSRFEV